MRPSSPPTSRPSTQTVSRVRPDAVDPSTGDPKSAPWRALFFFTTTSHVPLLALGISISIVTGAITPVRAFLLGKLYDAFTAYATNALGNADLVDTETKYVLYLLGLAAASWVLHSLEFAVWLAYGELQAKSARDRLFCGLLTKEIAWFDLAPDGFAAMLPRLQGQIRELQLATAQPLGSAFYLASSAVLSLAQAFVYSWNLTLVTLASAPVIMVVLVWIGRNMQHFIGQQQAHLVRAQKFSTSALSAIEVVKCFNAEETEAEKFHIAIGEAAGWYARIARSSALRMALIILLSTSLFVQGFYYGGILIDQGKLDSGQVITTFFCAIGAFQSIQAMFPQMLVLEKGRSAGATLRATMAKTQSGSVTAATTDCRIPANCRGAIALKNVTFAYPARPHSPVLKNVSMYIPSEETTFVIGKSGSGKSTLGQLLVRFYTASQGVITLDDLQLTSLDLGWLRSNITLVEQHSVLFNDTVHHNIAFGCEAYRDVSRIQSMQAAEFALLRLMIADLPDGLDTVVGYKGTSMSGGQRQRMALARARLRDTPILILDESTSALDQTTRTLLMEAIRQWRRGKTTIIITHDISQILPDDYAFVLEHGKLVQEGFRRKMERLKDSPFRSFLTEEEVQVEPPADGHECPSYKSSSSEESPMEISTPDKPLDSPETTRSNQDGDSPVRKHFSLMQHALAGGGPLPSGWAFGSPWFRGLGLPLLSSPAGTINEQTSHAHLGDISSTHNSPVDGHRWSSMLEDLVDQAGKLAVGARSGPPRRVQKQDIDNDMIVPLDMRTANGWSEGDHSITFHQIFASLWPNLNRMHKLLLIAGFWGATVHAVASPMFAFVLSKLLATYSVRGEDKANSLKYAMVILGVALVDAGHTYVYCLSFDLVGQRWIDAVRVSALRKVLHQPRSFFEREENGVSRLADCLEGAAESMRNLLGRFAALGHVAIVMLAVSLVWNLAVQWKLTLIALAAGPYIYVVTKAFGAVSEKWERHSNDAAESASAVFSETLNNIKTVRALTMEAHFTDKYLRATRAALRIGFQRALYAGAFYGLSDSAGDFTIAMIFYVGAKLVSSGTSVNDIVQVFTMLIFTILNVSAILPYIPQVGSAKDNASRLLRLARLPQDSHERLGSTRLLSIGDIVFEKLRFAYPSRPEQTIFHSLDLHLLPGTCIGLVGGSGSGKSTIANLLLKLYSDATITESHSKCLTISGRSIHHIHTPTLRTLIVPVSQTPMLLAGTVAENISYGLAPSSVHNTPETIATAARQVGVHDFIMSLPLGYDTAVGDGGLGLSGGQAQRIAIARALVRKPAVLILDEVTSALDVESAAVVRQSIQALVAKRLSRSAHAMTIIIITHHRDMMEIADRLIVMEQGRIVEEGAAVEMLARDRGPLANLLSGGTWTSESSIRNELASRNVPTLKSVNWR